MGATIRKGIRKAIMNRSNVVLLQTQPIVFNAAMGPKGIGLIQPGEVYFGFLAAPIAVSRKQKLMDVFLPNKVLKYS